MLGHSRSTGSELIGRPTLAYNVTNRRAINASRCPVDQSADVHCRIVVTGEKGPGDFQAEMAFSLETSPTAPVSGLTLGRRIAGEWGVLG